MNNPDTNPEGGPALLALEPRQRAFVLEYIENGGKKAAAAITAGYPKEWARDTGSKLSRHPKVLAAIREVADRRIRVEAVSAIDVMIEIMKDPNHKDRFRAACEVANRSGLIVATQHEVLVTHKEDGATISRIVALAKQLNLDPVALLGSAGVKGEIIDAEFRVVDNEPEREESRALVPVSREIIPNRNDDWTWSPDQ